MNELGTLNLQDTQVISVNIGKIKLLLPEFVSKFIQEQNLLGGNVVLESSYFTNIYTKCATIISAVYVEEQNILEWYIKNNVGYIKYNGIILESYNLEDIGADTNTNN